MLKAKIIAYTVSPNSILLIWYMLMHYIKLISVFVLFPQYIAIKGSIFPHLLSVREEARGEKVRERGAKGTHSA